MDNKKSPRLPTKLPGDLFKAMPGTNIISSILSLNKYKAGVDAVAIN